jgi:type IV pilus assembly protein PilA
MLNKLRQRARDEKGFTLIELLVVILIIGILAAIAIPSFLGQRDKANDAKSKSEVRTAQTAMETFYTDGQTYVGANLAALQAVEPSLGTDPNTTVSAPSNLTASSYTVTATSSKTSVAFTITRNANGTVTRSCTPANKGGCKNSSW